MPARYNVRIGRGYYVKEYQRTKGGIFAQYTVLTTTDERSKACPMSWNMARTIAKRNHGLVAVA